MHFGKHDGVSSDGWVFRSEKVEKNSIETRRTRRIVQLVTAPISHVGLAFTIIQFLLDKSQFQIRKNVLSRVFVSHEIKFPKK